MALAAGDLVYLNSNAEIQQDAPLFGVVDFVNGVSPDTIRVTWENGVQSLFSAEATSGLVEISLDPDQSIVGKAVVVHTSNSTLYGQIYRTFFSDPNGSNFRTAVIRRKDGWLVEPFSSLDVAQ